MADGSSFDREPIDKRLREIIAESRLDARPPRAQAALEGYIEIVCDAFLMGVRSGRLTSRTWPALEAGLRACVRTYDIGLLIPTEARHIEHLLWPEHEWLAWIEELSQRQGTHMPDWSAFYAERAELDRKIEERDDG
jgi:hypothetical protein